LFDTYRKAVTAASLLSWGGTLPLGTEYIHFCKSKGRGSKKMGDRQSIFDFKF
jgi:hypothetical protein